MKQSEAIQRAVEIMRRQHKSISTERTYIHWLRRYMAALAQFPPALSSEEKLERFLTEIALRDGVSASTQNQAS